MKKNVKNDKVIRAITIGISAMMAATSMPTVVFAEEINDADKTEEQNTATEASEKSESVKEEVTEIKEQHNIEETKEFVETAQESVVVADEKIDEAAGFVNEAVQQQEVSAEAFTEHRKNIEIADEKAEAVSQTVDEAANTIQEKSDAIDGAATVAEVDQLVSDAREALEVAKAECETLEGEFEEAKEAYEAALERMKNADAAEAKAYEEAKKKYEKASEDLENAKTNLQDALKAAADAQEKAENKQAELSGLINAINDQLKVVADKQSELQNTTKKLSDKQKNEIWTVNDDLTPLLVKYDFYLNNACDPGSVQVSSYIKGGASRDNYVVISYAIDGQTYYKFYDYLPTDVNGNTTNGTDDAIKNLYQIRVVEKPIENLTYNNNVITSIDSVNADGTINITYKNANGKDVKVYNKKPVFESKGEGNLTPDSVKASAEKLEKTIADAKDAKDAVKAAQDKVDALQKQIDEIEFKSLDEIKGGSAQALSILKAQLDAAQTKLDAAIEKKESLDAELDNLINKANARKDAINTPVNRPSNSSRANVQDAPVASEEINFVATPAVQADGGAGVADVNANVGADVNEAGEDPEVMNLEDEVTPLAAFDGEGIELEDEATPLASFGDEDFELGNVKNMSWIWAIIVALFGATGYELYKKNQKKKMLLAAKKKEEDEDAR